MSPRHSAAQRPDLSAPRGLIRVSVRSDRSAELSGNVLNPNRSRERRPDDVVENTLNAVDCDVSEAAGVEKLTWLGGRDSNPDNVVQRAVNALRSLRIRSVAFGSSMLTDASACSALFWFAHVQNVSFCLRCLPRVTRPIPYSQEFTSFRQLRPTIARTGSRAPRRVDREV